MTDIVVDGYPSEWDVEWVAVDRRNRVGVFTTGGAGPIPRGYLASSTVIARIRDAVWAIPERTESVLLAAVPRPDDFEAFARRGFFAFDWADVGRVDGRSGLYECQARPAMPVEFDAAEWPAEVRDILRQSRSESLDFEQGAVDVRALDCVTAPK
jgi:hypothetical protein